MEVRVKPIDTKTVVIPLESMSPMIQHAWTEKARKMMRDKKAGKKTKTREVTDPHAEALAATHFTADADYGIPAGAIKKAIINAAHKDLGIEKTLVRKSLFVVCADKNNVIKIECDPPVMREDSVRVGAGSADLRYRPEFASWRCDLEIMYDGGNLTIDDIVNLVNRAGFGVGVMEWRPEKGGDYGRFRVRAEG